MQGDEAWEEFAREVREGMVKKMADSAFVVSLVPSVEKLDVKFAVELGAAIMLEKPILLVVFPNVSVPKKLELFADEIVVCDLDTQAGKDQVQAAVSRMLERIK